ARQAPVQTNNSYNSNSDMKTACCAVAAFLLVLALATPGRTSTTPDATAPDATTDVTPDSTDIAPTGGPDPTGSAPTGGTDSATDGLESSTAGPDPTGTAPTESPDPTDTAPTGGPDSTIAETAPTGGPTDSIPDGATTESPPSTADSTESRATAGPTGETSGAPTSTLPTDSSSASSTPLTTGSDVSTPEQTSASPAPPETTQSSSSSNPTPQPTLQPDVSYSVPTPYGQINGMTYSVRVSTFSDKAFNTKRVSRFLGIPYALPPTQTRRFKSPVKYPASSSNVVNATEHKPSCPQQGQTYDEDCLYYNVWTVQTAENANSSQRYPVLVYIHEGRFETGYSSNPLRQGEELVTHNNVVVVTFNYRLGALGFLTLNRTSYTGNYGIQDQKVAIQVIYETISAFGGNQSQITLMGLDAGSASIGFHMMSSNTSAYFSRAIMMGGSPMMPWSLTNDLEYVQLLSLLFISGSLNCTSVTEPALTQCLQNIPVGQLISLQNNFTRFFQGLEFSPVIDGTTIAQDPWHAFSTGNFNSKDLLIGSTNDEGANIAEDGLEALNIPIFGVNDSMLVSLIERSIAYYPRASRTLSAAGRQFLRLHFTGYTGANNGTKNFATLGKAVGDWYLTCPVIQMAQFAEKLNPNVYLYYFTEKELNQDKWQASHGVDADYAFGVPTLSTGIIYPDVNKVLSERVMRNFVEFAAEGRPTGADLWKPLNYTSGNEMNYINYNADARILGTYQHGYRMSECHFWNKTLAYVNGLEQPPPPPTATTTTATTATTATTTSAATEPPIGPIPSNATSCGEWDFNSATATTMGVLLGTQAVTAGALGFVLYKWKSLARVSSQPI
ncbi:hypothetical protein BOX15_Mlig028046g2, partial [Macrostomum lignano]